MSSQIGDFVQLSDDHARFDMTDGVGTRDGSLRTPHDYVSSLEARLKLAEVTSFTLLDAGGSVIKWSYGIRQLKRADLPLAELCLLAFFPLWCCGLRISLKSCCRPPLFLGRQDRNSGQCARSI